MPDASPVPHPQLPEARTLMARDDVDDRPVSKQESKRIVAGICGIVLGGLGVHKFILGYTVPGLIQLVLGFCFGVGAVIGLIEGIIYLTKSDEEFIQTYQVGQKHWF
jgi:TM2 domain-containing membrane protein YozV